MLLDGRKEYLTCANCKARLVELWHTRPEEKNKLKFKANCPFCGDKSYIKEFSTGFHFSGIALPSEEEDIDFLVTRVSGPFFENDVYNFLVEKEPNAKPIK